MQTGSLDVGSPLKTLPVFSSTGKTALPMDAGVRLTEERSNDLSSLMAELPSHAVTTTVLNSGVKGSNASVLLAEPLSDAVTTTVLNSAVNLSNASGLTTKPSFYVVSPEVFNSAVNGSNMNGHNDVDHYGHYHSSMHHHDQGAHVVGDHIEHHDSSMHHHDKGVRIGGEHVGHHHNSIHHHDDGVHGNRSPQPYSVQGHGVGQHISTSLVEGHSECVDSGTSHLSQSVEQHIVTDIGTKIRIYRRTPRVKRVQETVLVPELSYEMRPIVLTKNRVVMVDVEEVEMVPIIKEVKKMKRIIVHKIREERRNQTCSEPVIEYVRRGTKVRVPRVVKVEEDVEIKVPVIKRVQEKVRVEVPTGEWIERPVVPDSNVSNMLNNAKVEAVLARSKYVDFVILRQDWVHGHSVALIAANQAALERWAKDFGVGYSDFAELCSKREARKEVLASLTQVARESGLEIFEIPTEVRLYRGDKLNAFLTVMQMTEFNTHVKPSGTNWDTRDVKLGKVEAVLVRSKYVDFVMLRLDSVRGRSVALIAANQAALESWAKLSGVGYSDFAELCAKPEARKEVLASLMQVAKEGALESSEIPAKVRLYRGDVLKAFLLVAETTNLNSHSNTPATYWEIRDMEKLVKYRTREYVEYAKHDKVEAVLVRSKYVDFVMLRLDSVRGHCVALVAANQAALVRWAKDSGTVYTDFSELCAKPEARKEVLASLIQVAKEGALESSEIPTKVILYRREVLKAFLTITRTTKLNSHLRTPASRVESLDVKEVQGDAMLGKVESVLRRSPYVDSLMLRVDSVGGHCVALVVANQAPLERWAKNAGVHYSDFAELCLKAEARKEVLDSLIQVAREGQYEGFKIPSEVALLANRDDMLTHMRRNHRIASTAPINVATSPVHVSNEAVHLGSGPVLVINDEVRKGESVTPVQTINEVVSRGTGAGTVSPVKIIKEEEYLGKGSEIGTPVETINDARYGGKAVDNGTLVHAVNGAVYEGKGVEIVPPQGGEYGLLRKVEAVLKCSPYVDYVMVHPDPIFGNYVAQVVADQAVLERWAKDSGVGYSDFADLCTKPEVRKEVLTSIMEVARKGGLERFEIPTEVALVAEHGDLVTVALMGTQKTTLKHRADDFYSRFLNLTVQEKGSRDVNVLDKVFYAVNMQADKYTSLGKVEEVVVRSPYVDSVMLHLDPIHGHCVALGVGNRRALEDWAKSHNVHYSDFADLVSKPETRKKVLASVIQMAREGGLESFEFPKKIALLADRSDLLNVAAMLTHMTRLKQREGNLNMRFLELRVHDKESRDVEVLDKVLDAVNVEAGEYGRLGKVEKVLERSPYADNVLLHLDPIHDRCVALILANPAALEDWAKSTSVEYSDFADLCSKLEARKEVLTSLIQMAREGELERFEIPMEVTLVAAGDDLVTAAITRREGPVMTERQVDLLDEEWRTGSVLAGWAHQQNVVHE